MDTTELKAALEGTGKSVSEFLKGFSAFAEKQAGSAAKATEKGAAWWKEQFNAYIMEDASGVKGGVKSSFESFRDKVFPDTGFDGKALWGEINGAAKSVADDGYGIWKAIKNNWAWPVGAVAGFAGVFVAARYTMRSMFGVEEGSWMSYLVDGIAVLLAVTGAYAGAHWLGKWAHGTKPADDKDPSAAGVIASTATGSVENAKKYAAILEKAGILVNGEKLDETGMLGKEMYMQTAGAKTLVGAIITEAKDDLKDKIITDEELAHLDSMFSKGVSKAKSDGHVVNVSVMDVGRKPPTMYGEIQALEKQAREIK
ncbi:MAG: hypothetical protein MRY32_02070 [Rickettsiales bacterium]|nr:hypothetical protein [Rickettsiales bacterium]